VDKEEEEKKKEKEKEKVKGYVARLYANDPLLPVLHLNRAKFVYFL